jgi:hypothetical protein
METQSPPLVAREVSLAAERRFFAWLSVAVLAMAVAGFTRTYLLVPALGLPEGTLAPTPLVHIHASIFFGWCVLLVVQSWLVTQGRTDRHRRLGLIGLVLYCGLVVTGPMVAVRSVVRNGGGVDELAFLAVSLGNVVAYTTIFAAAFHWRRRPDIHKRLMLVGMVVLLTAPFGRLLNLPILLEHVVGPGIVVIALAVWDFSAHRKIHFVTRIVGPAVLVWELLPNLYMNSEPWLNFARWLLQATT